MILRRNNVNILGEGSRTIVFSHGFGCDQHMWGKVAEALAPDYRIILFDHVGAGRSDLAAYDREKYSNLAGYADDVVEIGRELQLHDAVFVGHSVSAMIGALATLKAPDMFSDLVMVGPSPRYIDDGSYIGGFSRAQVDELLDFLADNHLGWSAAMAPAIIGNPDRPELGETLTNSFCNTDPEIARDFARVTFMSDHRADLPKLTAPTLLLQCDEDIIAPVAVGEYMHRVLPNSKLAIIRNVGHCPHLSSPSASTDAIDTFLATEGL